MGSDKRAQFANRKYLNLETYRKSGQGVRTPVWFAENDGQFYLYTLADSYKVKRILHNPRVRIAPCDVRGNVKGEWVEATARILDHSGDELTHELLNRKYGWIKRISDFIAKLRHHRRASIAIEVD